MAKIVEAERLEPGSVPCTLKSTAESGWVEPPTEPVREDIVIRPTELVPATQPIECSRSLVRERNLPGTPTLRGTDLGIAR